MILVDSSAWIERLRGSGTLAARSIGDLVRDRPTEVATTEPIQMELWCGVGSNELARVEALTSSLVLLSVEPALDHAEAAAIYRATRANGRAARKANDCLIASVALRHDAEVWHRDADFEAIAAVTELRTRDLR